MSCWNIRISIANERLYDSKDIFLLNFVREIHNLCNKFDIAVMANKSYIILNYLLCSEVVVLF